MNFEPVTVSRDLNVSPSAVFDVLACPVQHLKIDGSGCFRPLAPLRQDCNSTAGSPFRSDIPANTSAAKSARIRCPSDSGRTDGNSTFLEALNAERGTTVIMITHEWTTRTMTSRLILVDHGTVVYDVNLTTLQARYAPYREVVVQPTDPALAEPGSVRPPGRGSWS